jgi:alkylation response protein AidB-like acyl-CoA dehydrogenase
MIDSASLDVRCVDELNLIREPEEQAMFRKTVVRMLDKHCPKEVIGQWDAEDYIPRDSLLKEWAEAGLLGLTVPEEFGGMGKNVVSMIVLMEEMARRWQAICALYNQSVGYGSLNIAGKGSQKQKEYFLPRLMAGEIIFAYALSEPAVGADLASVQTTADRQGDKVIVNGTKRWISGANLSDYFMTLVRSGPKEDRRKNLSFVMIPRDLPGVTVVETPCMGTKGISTHEVTFDNVEVPFDRVLGEEEGFNNGWKMLVGPVLEVEKLVPTTIGFGIARAALDEAWEYTQTRTQFGKTISAHQAVRHKLADCLTKLQACRHMLYDAAALVERGEESAMQTCMAKLFIGETAKEITLTCLEIMGAYGYAKGFGMERHVRDVLAVPIYGGSSMVQRNNITSIAGLRA